MKYQKGRSLVRALAAADAFRLECGSDALLRSHFVYAVVSEPRALMSFICIKLGLDASTVRNGVMSGKYRSFPYTTADEEKAAARFLSDNPTQLLRDTHVFLELCLESDFVTFLFAIGIDPNSFATECYGLSGRSRPTK